MKPGYKTSEFWLAFVASLVSFLLASGLVVEGSMVAQVVGFIGGVLASMGYTVGRSSVKKAEALAKAVDPS